jgi:DMSO reductase family type II enzyme heme b subunit
VRALTNGSHIAFRCEWSDPTESRGAISDAAFLQFAAKEGSKPYFLFGDADKPVVAWLWRAGAAGGPDPLEQLRGTGPDAVSAGAAPFTATARWVRGRWQVIWTRPVAGEPQFGSGGFVPILFSTFDGANAERGNQRATSTWIYVTCESAGSMRPILLGLSWIIWVALAELALLRRLRK